MSVDPIRAWVCVVRDGDKWHVRTYRADLCAWRSLTGGPHTSLCGEKILLHPDSWQLRQKILEGR